MYSSPQSNVEIRIGHLRVFEKYIVLGGVGEGGPCWPFFYVMIKTVLKNSQSLVVLINDATPLWLQRTLKSLKRVLKIFLSLIFHFCTT